MTCVAEFTIQGVTVGTGSLTEVYQISREVIRSGLSTFRAADGTGALDVLFEKMRWTISGSGGADPALYSIDLTLPTWTVVIPGFANGSPDETWVVVPARPSETKDKISGKTGWSLILEQAN